MQNSEFKIIMKEMKPGFSRAKKKQIKQRL